MKHLVVLLFSLAALNANAQNYNWEAPVGAVEQEGYYRIQIPPTIACQLAPGFPDIKIRSAEPHETPYVWQFEKRTERFLGFREYEIVDKQYNSGWRWQSRYIIRNADKSLIGSLLLKVKNFEARKRVRLSGSDDRGQWFVIKDGYVIYGAESDTSDAFYKILAFPKSNYEYYKIEVDDHWRKDPINLVAAGTLDKEVVAGSFLPVTTVTFTQRDSSETKQTIVDVNLNAAHYIDKLTIDFDSDENFYRYALIEVKRATSDTTFRYDRLVNAWFSSTALNEFNFHKLRAKELRITIDNKDDVPLRMKNLQPFILNQHLVAKLKPGQDYKLTYGNDTIPAPEYDLGHFTDEFPDDMKVLSAGTPVKIMYAGPEPAAAEEVPFFENPVTLWLTIGLVIIVLGYLSMKMLREASK